MTSGVSAGREAESEIEAGVSLLQSSSFFGFSGTACGVGDAQHTVCHDKEGGILAFCMDGMDT